MGFKVCTRPVGGGYPLLASRGCPEFCTYCPHRILAGYRMRSIANIVDEMERLCDQVSRPYVIFRDPLFTEQRDRVVELCDEIMRRGLKLTFEAETRLDRLDVALLDKLHAAGFRAMSFGVESSDPTTLKKSGRRPVPLVPGAIAILRAHRQRTRGKRMLVGPDFTDHGFVFHQPDGSWLTPGVVSQTFLRRVGRYELPRLTLHGLRHTWATLALERGIHPRVVQERLGHSTIAITLGIYSHVSPTLHDEAAQLIADVML